VKLIKVETLYITFNNNNNNLNGEYMAKFGPKLSGPLADPDYLWFPERKLCMYSRWYCGEIKTGFLIMLSDGRIIASVVDELNTNTRQCRNENDR
jgi:hypothetical protein